MAYLRSMPLLPTIAPGAATDGAAIATIASWYVHEWNTPEPDTREALANQPTKAVILQLGAYLNNMLVATGGLRSEVNLVKVHPQFVHLGPWIGLLYTAVGHRGNGIGAQLLSAFESEAQKLGFSTIYLYTFTAEALYTRMGWEPLTRVPYKGHDTVLMRKALS